MEQTLSSLILTQEGYYFWDSNKGEYVFIPAGSEELLASYQHSLFTIVGGVTGEILTPKVEIDGATHNWGEEIPLNSRYRIIAYAKYHSGDGEKKRTGMYLIVYAPDGAEYSCSDSELLPYTAPDTQITFSLPTPSDNPLGWVANVAGAWTAKLEYKWIK